jgi:YhcH/YjgK/YiaL family protein
MLFDRLDRLQQYGNLPHGISDGAKYLLETDFSKVAEGRYELNGDRLVAIVQQYETHLVTAARWEAHRRYVDIQYIIEGQELMGHRLLNDGIVVQQPYDADRDVIFYEGPGCLFLMQPKDVAVFFPQDIHAPGLAVHDQLSKVRKVVVKCRID